MGVLFVDKRVLTGRYPAVLKIDGNKARVFIRDLGEKYIEDGKSKNEIVEFEFPFEYYTKYQKESAPISVYEEENLTIGFSRLITKKDKFIFDGDSKDANNDDIYALLCPRQAFSPGEVYISAEDCDKVTVIKTFNFCSYDITREMFMDRMYFVKIDLSEKESMNLHISTEKTECLRHRILLSKASFLPLVVNDCTEYIRLDEKANKSFIGLSKL